MNTEAIIVLAKAIGKTKQYKRFDGGYELGVPLEVITELMVELTGTQKVDQIITPLPINAFDELYEETDDGITV